MEGSYLTNYLLSGSYLTNYPLVVILQIVSTGPLIF